MMYFIRDVAAFASMVALGSSFWLWGQALASGL